MVFMTDRGVRQKSGWRAQGHGTRTRKIPYIAGMTTPLLFDPRALALHRRRAAADPADFLLRHVATDMADRLAAVLRPFQDAAEIGSLTPAVFEALRPGFTGTLQRVDNIA